MIPYRHIVHHTHNYNQLSSACSSRCSPGNTSQTHKHSQLTGPKCKLSINNRATVSEAGEWRVRASKRENYKMKQNQKQRKDEKKNTHKLLIYDKMFGFRKILCVSVILCSCRWQMAACIYGHCCFRCCSFLVDFGVILFQFVLLRHVVCVCVCVYIHFPLLLDICRHSFDI